MNFENRNRIFIVIALVTMLMLLISCGNGNDNSNGIGNMDEPNEPQIYYNGAYGIKVTVPADWLVAGISEINMTLSPDESSDPNALEVIPYEDSGSAIQFIELWSKPESVDKEHASLMVYIETYSGESEDSFLSAFEDAYSGEFSGYFSTFTAREEAVINGREYTRLLFVTQLPEGEEEYFEDYYISQIETGKYLVICTTYWADNEVSEVSAYSALSFIEVE